MSGVIHVYLDTTAKNQSLVQVSNAGGKDKSLQWKTTQLDVISSVPYSLAFEATRPLLGAVTVVIDDVQYLEGVCESQTSPPPLTRATPAGPFICSILTDTF